MVAAQLSPACAAGIVDLLQTVLQMYAGLALQVKLDDSTEDAMNTILTTPEAGWSIQVCHTSSGIMRASCAPLQRYSIARTCCRGSAHGDVPPTTLILVLRFLPSEGK